MTLGARRQEIVCVALIVAVALAVTWPLLSGEVLFYGDFSAWFLDARRLFAREVHAGHLPLWNPHVGLGTPLLGNPLVGVAYPPAMLQLLGDVLGDDRVWLGRTVPLHLIFGGLSSYALARSFGARPLAALVAGVAMTAGAIPIAGAENLYTLWSLSWLPLTFLALHRALSDRSWRWAIVAGASVAMLTLAGDVARLIDVTFLGVALLSAQLCASRGAGASSRMSLALLAAVTAALLSAVMLAPALELLSRSSRLDGWSPDVAHRMSLPPWQLFGFLLRAPLGLTLPINSLFGDALLHDERLWYAAIYPGLAATLFAPFALVIRARDEDADRRRVFSLRAAAVLVVLFLLLSLGPATPFFDLAVHLFPPLGLFRYPAKHAGSIAWLLPFLGAVGLEAVLAGARTQRRIALVAAGLATAFGVATVVLAPLLTPHLAHLAHAPEIAALASAQIGADGRHLVLIGALFVAALATIDRAPRLGAALLAATLLLDGVRTGTLLLWTAQRTEVVAEAPFAEALRADAPSRLVHFPPMATLPLHRDRAGYLAVTRAMVGRLDWDTDAGEGVDGLAQYADLRVGDVTTLRDALLYTNAYFVLSEILATDHLIVSNDATLPPSFAARVGSGRLVEEAHTDGPLAATMFRDTQALPRAALFSAVVVAPDTKRPDVALGLLRDNELHRVAIVDAKDALQDGRSVALDVKTLLEKEHIPEVTLGAVPSSIAPVTAAEVTAPSPADRVVHVHADRPSLLVLADVFYPGWRAEVDGQAATIVRASLVARGVVVPSGDHVVTFRYRPRSVLVGAALSGVAWLALLAFAAITVSDRMRRSARSAGPRST